MVSVWLFFLTCWCASASASSVQFYPYNNDRQAWILFEQFITTFRKSYNNNIEKLSRFEVFKLNLQRVNRYNAESKLAVHGITKFMDVSPMDFGTVSRVPYHNSAWRSGNDYDQCQYVKFDRDIPVGFTPESFDWRSENAVTGVKDQGSCGSCWAFASVGHLEGRYYLKHKKLIEFSEQQLINCSALPCQGCNGGRVTTAFKSLIRRRGGPMKEVDYRYLESASQCRLDYSKVVAKISDCVSYNLTQQRSVQQLLYQFGPLPVALRSEMLQTYKYGIIEDGHCGNGQINHGVLLVGYGTENNKRYWVLKNSWGTNWGENGYFRMERSDTGDACGIMNPSMAIVNFY